MGWCAVGVGLTAVGTNAIAMSILIRDPAFGPVTIASSYVRLPSFLVLRWGASTICCIVRLFRQFTVELGSVDQRVVCRLCDGSDIGIGAPA